MQTWDTPASHRALHTVELILAIIENYDFRSRSGRATCARLALVCRSFYDIASPLVWRTLPQLVPLWRLLLLPYHDQDCGALPKQWEEKHVHLIMDGKPYENRTKWDNFLKHAHYVREVDHANRPLGDRDLIRMLVAHNGGKTFLPSLQRLQWHQTRDSSAPLESLACTALLELHLDCSDQSLNNTLQFNIARDMQVLAAELAPSFPCLRTFIVDASDFNDTFTPMFERSLSQFRHLRTLRITRFLRPVTFTFLSSLLPRLEHFECPIRRVYNESPLWNDLHAPTLRELTCWGIYADLYALTSSLRAPALETVHMESEVCNSPDCQPTGLGEFLEQVTASKFSCSLRSITVTVTVSAYFTASSEQHVELVDARMFRSPIMFKLRSLSIFFVPKTQPSSSIIHTDESILALAQALPNLEFFRSFFMGVLSPPELPLPALTPMSLVHLARHCPLLRETHLLINLNSPLPATLDFEPPRGHPLRVLDLPPALEVDRQVIAAPKELARVFDGLFPDLDVQASVASTKIMSPESIDRSWHEMWDEVESLQRHRKDESNTREARDVAPAADSQ